MIVTLNLKLILSRFSSSHVSSSNIMTKMSANCLDPRAIDWQAQVMPGVGDRL